MGDHDEFQRCRPTRSGADESPLAPEEIATGLLALKLRERSSAPRKRFVKEARTATARETAFERILAVPLRLPKEAGPLKRLPAVLSGCALIATALAGTAAADPPTREVENVAGDQIRCGDTLLTATSGRFVSRQHVHRLRSGLFRVIFTGTARKVRLEDEQGRRFRAVGSAHGTFTTRDPEQKRGEVGFFGLKIVIVGRGGKLGTVEIRERVKRNGDTVTRNRGNCEFVEP